MDSLRERFGQNDASVEVGCEDNRGLVEAFTEMSSHEFKNGDKFKGISYKKVAVAISELTAPVTSGKKCASGKGKLPGVGKASGEKIDE